MTNRLLIHVVEVPVNERGGKSPERGSADAPRDLLPWADPYVAAVIRRISAAQSSLGGGTMGDPAESDPRIGAPRSGWRRLYGQRAIG